MLNFIICDDNKEFTKSMKALVDKFMMNYDMEYKTHILYNYGSKFRKLVQEDIGFKVYLLDIQTAEGSGIDAARCIREEFDDWVSIIVIITAYNQYKYDALGNRLYLLDFINKLDNCENKVRDVLKVVMKHYDKRYKALGFEYNHIVHKVEYRHIVYIEKEQDSKRCIIKTTYGDQTIGKNLNDMMKLLEKDRRFMKVSRSMIVNLDHVVSYDIKESKIEFDNGEVSYLVSRENKKELKKRVGAVD